MNSAIYVALMKGKLAAAQELVRALPQKSVKDVVRMYDRLPEPDDPDEIATVGFILKIKSNKAQQVNVAGGAKKKSSLYHRLLLIRQA